MAFQFPASPVVGQTYTPSAGITFKWNGTAWYLVNSTLLTPTEADTRYVQIANARSMESRIINGNFAIDQRNAGTALNISTFNVYTLDRWICSGVGGGSFAVQRTVGVTAGQTSIRALAQTLDATLAALDYYFVGQIIEGNHVADLLLGSAAAMPFTFACELYSNFGGTFPIAFRNGDASLSYVKTVTLAPATVTPVKITVPGPTTGTWNAGNGIGLQVSFGLGIGATLNAPAADSWQAGNFLGVAGCTNMMATASSQFYIFNARLYPGSIDYGPCQRLYADELRLCQRYFEKSYEIETVPGTATFNGAYGERWLSTTGQMITIPFKVSKRGTSTITYYSAGGTGAVGKWRNVDTNTDFDPQFNEANQSSIRTVVPSGTAGQTFLGHWTASAEL